MQIAFGARNFCTSISVMRSGCAKKTRCGDCGKKGAKLQNFHNFFIQQDFGCLALFSRNTREPLIGSCWCVLRWGNTHTHTTRPQTPNQEDCGPKYGRRWLTFNTRNFQISLLCGGALRCDDGLAGRKVAKIFYI